MGLYSQVLKRQWSTRMDNNMGTYGDMLPWTIEGVVLTALFIFIIGIAITFAYHFIKGGRPWV